jgi:hypothetical protein
MRGFFIEKMANFPEFLGIHAYVSSQNRHFLKFFGRKYFFSKVFILLTLTKASAAIGETNDFGRLHARYATTLRRRVASHNRRRTRNRS